MGQEILGAALVILLASTAILFWIRVREQVYERRVQRRIHGIRHLTAVMRAYFAEQRHTA